MEDKIVSGLNIYDVNKQMMMNKKPLTEKEILDGIDDICMDVFKKGESRYYMMLCREKADYTLFNFKGVTTYDFEMAKDELKECLHNRGKVIEICEDENNQGYEIWIKDTFILSDTQGEIFMYLVFPCDQMVIEV